jgi:hypothetical protein
MRFLARGEWDNMGVPDMGIRRKADTTVAIDRRLSRDASEIHRHIRERIWSLLGLRRAERRERRGDIADLKNAFLGNLNIALIQIIISVAPRRTRLLRRLLRGVSSSGSVDAMLLARFL